MTEWVVATITDLGYVGIFLLMLVESIFPPIPSELIIPFAGFSAAEGNLNFFGVLAAASLGSLAGMVPWYVAGRLFGLDRLRRYADRYGRWLTLNADQVDRATEWFDRHGPWVVFFGRLVPIIRTLISLPAGLARMPVAVFFLASLAGILLWNIVLVLAGYLLHEHYERVEAIVDPLTYIVIAGVIGFYIFRLVTWRPSRG